jgi:O-antigen ligase
MTTATARLTQTVPLEVVGPEEPRIAVWIMVAAIGLFPVLTPQGPGNSAPVDFVMAVGIGAALFWAGSTRQPLHVPYAVAGAVLIGSGALAGLLGEFAFGSFQALIQELALFAWMLSVVAIGRYPSALGTLLRGWAWTAVAWAALVVGAAVTGQWALAGMPPGGGRAQLYMLNPNQTGSYFLVSLLVALASKTPRAPAARGVAVALMLLALLFTGTMAGMGGILFGGALTIAFLVGRRFGVPAAASSLATMAFFAGILAVSVDTSRIVDSAQTSSSWIIRNGLGRADRSSEGRVLQLSQLMGLYRSGALVGHGPAATKPLLEQLQSPYVKEAHNDYAGVLVERGVFGAVGLVLLFGAVGLRAIAVISQGLSPRYTAVVPSLAPLLFVLVALGVTSFTHETLHYRHVWTFYGVLAALYLFGRDEPARFGRGNP